MGNLSLTSKAESAPDRLAIVGSEGSFTFGELTVAANTAAAALLDRRADLGEARVALLIAPGFRYVAAQWGTWAAGGISVPLCISDPPPALEYVIDDSEVSVIVASTEYHPIVEPIARTRQIPLIDADQLVFAAGEPPELPIVDEGRRALILYTSGSTGKPKGVVWTHANLEAQLRALSEAWEWSADDRILLALPLHHVHGLVNVVTCALWNTATCEALPKFDATAVIERLTSGAITTFMAVPTIYRRLVLAWEAADESTRHEISESLSKLRLMVSGSAALPVPTLDRWREISGHTLLERYGMTEIGMALSNSYRGARIPGSVGTPLPTVEARLVDDDGSPAPAGTAGEIEIKGPSVFKEYWRRPDATAEAFRDGWFRTGDVAVLDDGVYRILGRRSVDIIKTGGEKVSALEIEDVLRDHPDVEDCAVIGVEDADWGERVVVAVAPTSGAVPDLESLRTFARERLASHKLPRELLVVDDLPRNALGKVVKPRLKEMFATAIGGLDLSPWPTTQPPSK